MPSAPSPARFAPWFGVFGGLVAWFAHLATTYVLVPFQCHNLPLFGGVTAVLGGVAVAATWSGWRTARRSEGDGRRPGRARFMGYAGLLISGFFLAVIVAEALPLLLQDPCLIPGPRIILAPFLGLLAGGLRPAALLAHEPGTFPVPGELWGWWSWQGWILVPLGSAAALYGVGLKRLWRHAGVGRGIPVGRAACYAGGLLALFVALVSPVDAWGAALFSAHMVQHLLLMVVAAPLLVLGSPVVAWLWALPPGKARRIARGWNGSRPARATWAWLSHPVGVWLLHALAVWIWHVPRLYEAALHSELLHGLEHATFFFSALLFWHVLTRARVHRWFGYGAGVLYVFAGAVQSGVLGALITFSPRPWYPSHQIGAEAWGLSALEDQQLAGLIMWIPAGVVYVCAALLLFLGWMALAERKVSRSEAEAGGSAAGARGPRERARERAERVGEGMRAEEAGRGASPVGPAPVHRPGGGRDSRGTGADRATDRRSG